MKMPTVVIQRKRRFATVRESFTEMALVKKCKYSLGAHGHFLVSSF